MFQTLLSTVFLMTTTFKAHFSAKVHTGIVQHLYTAIPFITIFLIFFNCFVIYMMDSFAWKWYLIVIEIILVMLWVLIITRKNNDTEVILASFLKWGVTFSSCLFQVYSYYSQKQKNKKQKAIEEAASEPQKPVAAPHEQPKAVEAAPKEVINEPPKPPEVPKHTSAPDVPHQEAAKLETKTKTKTKTI